MDEKQLLKYERQLYSETPLVGGWLRRIAAEALAEDSSPEAVKLLAVALTRTEDGRVRPIALEAMRSIADQPAIDAACAVWAGTRHSGLGNIIRQKAWVGTSSVDVFVLSALKAGRTEAVTNRGSDVVQPLVKACVDVEPIIAQEARACLSKLSNHEAIDEICCLWEQSRGNALLAQAMARGKYVARQPARVRVLSALRAGLGELLNAVGVEVVTPLLTACSDVEPVIAQEARTWLTKLNNSEAIDEICRLWAQNRGNAQLAQAVAEGRYVARQPANVRVLSALKAGRGEVLYSDGKEIVGLLLQACEDEDFEVSSKARDVLLNLSDGGAREELCQLALERGHIVALETAVKSGYAPVDQYHRALFYFISEQRDKYADLDFENTLLQAVYESADQELRGRILAKARESGQVESVGVVSGGRTGRRLGEMTDAEWEGVLGLLMRAARWSQMWRLAQEAPPLWAVRLVDSLGESDWFPPDEEEARVFRRLREVAVVCRRDEPDLQYPSLQANLEPHSSSVLSLAISPEGGLLASGNEDGAIRFFGLPEGKHLRTMEGHTSTVLTLSISPDGRLLASGSNDNTIRLWRLPGGEHLRTLKGHISHVLSLAIGPKGGLLASGSWDKTIRLWGHAAYRFSRLPVRLIGFEEVERAQETLGNTDLSDSERAWLEFIVTLVRFRRRHDIALVEAPRRMDVGEFDIEIEE